ncbi:MAG: imidazole glycerol phosphate synthase subunit HisH [Bacteroidales bacterium]
MIAILKYNAGNIRSVQNALNRAGYNSIITDRESDLVNADKVIIPGVGHAGQAMRYIREKELDKVILSLKQPVLGICLGLQLMCSSSEEDNTKCLGIFDSKVKRFPEGNIVPHMGWNNFTIVSGELLKGITLTDNMYYVHSYYAETGNCSVAVCEYIVQFSAAMQKDNFYATQFHPEKSGDKGELILRNFLIL